MLTFWRGEPTGLRRRRVIRQHILPLRDQVGRVPRDLRRASLRKVMTLVPRDNFSCDGQQPRMEQPRMEWPYSACDIMARLIRWTGTVDGFLCRSRAAPQRNRDRHVPGHALALAGRDCFRGANREEPEDANSEGGRGSRPDLTRKCYRAVASQSSRLP